MYRAPVLLWTSGICRSVKSSLVLSNAAPETQSYVDILSASSCDGRSAFCRCFTRKPSVRIAVYATVIWFKNVGNTLFMIWFILTVR
jgi:hypothetical protein